jgi:hypothetical protein
LKEEVSGTPYLSRDFDQADLDECWTDTMTRSRLERTVVSSSLDYISTYFSGMRGTHGKGGSTAGGRRSALCDGHRALRPAGRRRVSRTGAGAVRGQEQAVVLARGAGVHCLHQLGPSRRPDPIGVERMIQRRVSEVARMTAEAEAAGKDRLVMAPAEWAALVQRCMADPDLMVFPREIRLVFGSSRQSRAGMRASRIPRLLTGSRRRRSFHPSAARPTADKVGPIEAGPPGRVKLTRCTPSFMGRSFRGVPEVVQPAAVRPTRSALTCQSRAAAASS